MEEGWSSTRTTSRWIITASEERTEIVQREVVRVDAQPDCRWVAQARARRREAHRCRWWHRHLLMGEGVWVAVSSDGEGGGGMKTSKDGTGVDRVARGSPGPRRPW